MTKQALYDTLPERLSRSTPAIITQFHLPKNEQLFEKNVTTLDFFEKVGFSVTLNNLIQPYGLYLTFSSNPKDTIVIKEDILYREDKDFLDIVEGAIRSTPESGTPWRVTYLHYPPVLFQGNLILCTRLTEAAVRSKRKLDFCRSVVFLYRKGGRSLLVAKYRSGRHSGYGCSIPATPIAAIGVAIGKEWKCWFLVMGRMRSIPLQSSYLLPSLHCTYTARWEFWYWSLGLVMARCCYLVLVHTTRPPVISACFWFPRIRP